MARRPLEPIPVSADQDFRRGEQAFHDGSPPPGDPNGGEGWYYAENAEAEASRHMPRGEIVEHLYRDIRALRIYEGATEVQKLIVGLELLNEAKRT